MLQPDKIFSGRELRLFIGEDNDRMYIAYKNIGYDVADDLDNQAPHAGDVISHPSIAIVGRLKAE